MTNPDELFRIALELERRGQFQQALAAYERVLPFMADNSYLYYNRANILSVLGRHAEALADYDQSIVLKSDNHLAHFGRGNALDALGQLDAALASHEQAIRFNPDYWPAYANRGFVLQKLNRLDEALLSIERAIALNPNEAMLHYNRARWLTNLDRRPDEALTSYEHTIALLPDYARAHHGRGLALRNVGRMEEALAAHERAVELDPDNAIFQFGKGWQLLQLGDYANGFPLFEWRFRGGVRAKFREFRQPQWRGETAARQTLLLYAELGLGDNTQFVRYLPLAKARVGHVVLELPRTLWPLLGAMADGITLVEPGAALPEFDLHCVFMSLPYALGTTLNSVPAQVPYLTAPVERLPAWRARLPKTARVRVGLVWASSSTHYVAAKRNVQLTSLAPLLATEGVDFVSLQVQYRADDLPLLAQLPIERIDGAITDFGDTAAAIEQCDLVISVDTSVAHLAGALGKPVWVLLPFIADWRWLWNRNDSPWYPTARLFRQSRRDDWEDVIAKVARELAALF